MFLGFKALNRNEQNAVQFSSLEKYPSQVIGLMFFLKCAFEIEVHSEKLIIIWLLKTKPYSYVFKKCYAIVLQV